MVSKINFLLGIVLLCQGVLFAEEFTLSLNEEEKYAIREIVVTMGEKNIARLLLDSHRLTSLGNSIQHVPPLQFMGYIVTDSYLRHCLKKISKSTFKWSPFVDGFQTNMEKELKEGRVYHDLPGFAKVTHADLSRLQYFTERREWEKFIRYFL